MTTSASSDYGLWGLALVNAIVFIGFAYSFFKPATLRDWRGFGAYGAFVVALFAEMYGFPLTIYLLSGWLASKFPGVNLFGHDAGHLWWLLTSEQGNPHFGALHLLSFVFIFAGFTLLSKAWHVLYHAQRHRQLAKAGPYRLVRHPQYIALVAIMFGFLLQWPTLLTLAMFPVLMFMYVRLAIAEERDSEKAFGSAWHDYAAVTPRFVPRFSRTGREQTVDCH
jgi:protein-S-isoprenylcysteine O-methyltransferase Ste14